MATIDFSSPLAAMQPQPYAWGYRRDLPSRPKFGSQTFGANSFNFKDLSMKNSSQDYFGLSTVRGSSPTASLAADLSQNFTLDQSPHFPTPRRSLFTQNLFLPLNREGVTTPPIPLEGMTTPPILSSSPGFGHDSMDISPLPHKPARSFITQITVQSPTPEPTPQPQDEDMLSVCEPPPNPLLDVPRLANPLVERNRNKLLRPSLSRTKAYSTNTASFRSNGLENQLPAFQFGASSLSSTSSLGEGFIESPLQERKTLGAGLMGPPAFPRPRQSSIVNRCNGSPSSNHVRKPNVLAPRPKKQFRRSLSMFEHPGDVMKQEKEDPLPPSSLSCVMDVDEPPHRLELPHFFPENEPDSLPRIEKSTLVNVLNGNYSHSYEKIMVIDCRFEYEYNGGHIDGALNYNDKELLASELFTSPQPEKTLLVLHCEYSAHRAPLMAKFVRHRDRAVNDFRYPKLNFPELYILDGGYSAFFNTHKTHCFPQNYVEMKAEEHERECEKGMHRLKQRQKLSRAATFAFGTQSCEMENSPTAQGRSKSSAGLMHLGTAMDFGFTSISRSHARRMASY